MKTKKKKKPKKRIGTDLSVLLALLLVAILPLAAAPKKKPALDTYAVVSGSVFDSSGYALPGADATLAPDVQAQGVHRRSSQSRPFPTPAVNSWCVSRPGPCITS